MKEYLQDTGPMYKDLMYRSMDANPKAYTDEEKEAAKLAKAAKKP